MDIGFAGESIVLDASGALFLPAHEMMVVSDLHLEKGSYFAARGNPIPCHDTQDNLERLAEAVAVYRPRKLVCLGDSFHDANAAHRMSRANAVHLRALTGAVEDWIWVTGNHDSVIPDGFGGRAAGQASAGAIALHHMPEDGAPPVIAGHYHPKHRLRIAEQRISARCFVLGGDRLLMPAFGAYAGGLATSDPAIAAIFGESPRQHVMIYANKLWALG